jgi:geranylgeranyl diphosphate synthase type II
MRYSVLAPGKRLRPILALASAEAVGGDWNSVVPAACALECIHAFSLIHDDLPCMDDDEYRRGRPTNHVVFGEAMALLAGDALLAFEMLASNAADLAPERVARAVTMVARASGTWGMVGGQVVDMQSQGKDTDPETLQYIHAHKTGALLTASSCLGALLVGAQEARLAELKSFGERIGLAFQITDDVLDVVGDEDRIGKRPGSDAKHDKATYPKLYGLDESVLRARRESDKAIEALASFGAEADPLRALAGFVVERDL